jgi:DNA-binding CsgD family transcriptional regulator
MDAATTIITQALQAETWNRLARAKLLAAAAQIAIAAGDPAAAESAVDELDEIAEHYDSPVLRASAATSRGRVQVAAGDPGACGTLRAALSQWQQLDVPYEVATARMLLGLACRELGDHDDALVSFSAAEAAFELLGATLDVRLIRDLTSRRQLPGGLTEREAEVLRLVAAGRTNREIADALYLSEKTVARHLSNIFTKVGVSSRSGATAYAFEQRIVTPPS